MMSFKNWLKGIWPFKISQEKKIAQLLGQLECAISDLKIRIAQSLAREADLRRNMEQQKASVSALPADSEDQNAPDSQERLEFFISELETEETTIRRLKQIFNDLSSKKKSLELSYQQSLARLRNAETLNLIASLHKDFGEEMRLNNYLSKLSEESFKIQFTADSRLQIETILKESRRY